jgi:spore germination cell wall hydrolase CwlJ-like protein
MAARYAFTDAQETQDRPAVAQYIPAEHTGIAHTAFEVETPEEAPQENASHIGPTNAPESDSTETVEIEPPRYTDADIDIIARMVWGEARGTTPEEWVPVIWTALQRVDCPDRWPDTIAGVVRQRSQFHGYRSRHPVCSYIREVVARELHDWSNGAEPPTLYPFAPSVPYFFFAGRNGHNWFRERWR